MMATFQLTILGINSAFPAHGRHPTAQVLQIGEQLVLIDCGEGTQAQIQKYNIRKSKIRHILISHLHGDHIFGLIGLLTSLSLEGRTKNLDIYGPEGLEEIIRIQLKYNGGDFYYPVRFHILDMEKNYFILENKKFSIQTIPLNHRIPTVGFLIREKRRPRNIIKEKIAEYDIPYQLIPMIKEGGNFKTQDGKIIANDRITTAPPTPRSYAYCSDTRYTESIIPIIKGVDLLYHESTYCEDNKKQAVISMHSTAMEAAQIAKKAQVGQLILGHYSSRYKTTEQFEIEAQSIFSNSIAGIEGGTYKVPRLRSKNGLAQPPYISD